MILVIGYGNPLRRDDGAGPELARRLADRWEARGAAVRLIEEHQLLPELAADLVEPGVEMVLFVDTDAEADTPQVRRVRPKPGTPASTHHLTPQRLLSMARIMGPVPPRAWLATIPGRDFDHGEGFSDVTTEALDSLEERLLTLPESRPGRTG